jgi:hypothetical protein
MVRTGDAFAMEVARLRDSSSATQPRTCQPREAIARSQVDGPRDPDLYGDPKVFHQMSLTAFLAWVGLGEFAGLPMMVMPVRMFH